MPSSFLIQSVAAAETEAIQKFKHFESASLLLTSEQQLGVAATVHRCADSDAQLTGGPKL